MSHLDEGQLHELLDGELDEPARAAALAHLASCERCKAAYDEAASFLAEAEALIEAVQLPAVAVAVTESPSSLAPLGPTRAEPESPSRRAAEPPSRPLNRIATMRTLAWAATVVVAVGIGWASGMRWTHSTEPAATLANEAVAGGQPVAEPAAKVAAPVDSIAVLAEADRARMPARRQAATQEAPAKPQAVAPQPTAPPEADEERAKSMLKQNASADQVAQTSVAPAPPALADALRRDAPAPAAAGNAASTAQAIGPRAEVGYLAAKRAPATPTAFRVVGMEEAVRILGGSIRLIDGMTPTRLLTGRTAGSALVRVVYEDPPGRELWLDQGRETTVGIDAARDATTLLPGDTLLVVKEAGTRSLGWVDQHGFQLRLTGYLTGDSLQALQGRIR